jgi:O-antigen/teichoic acid export membrane protein
MDALGEGEALKRLDLGGSKVLWMLGLCVALIAAFAAPDFFPLWLGPTFQHEPYPSSAHLFQLLVVGSACTTGQRIGYQVLLGSRRHKAMGLLLAGEAVTSLLLGILLILPLGLLGVALASMVAALVFHGVLHPWVLLRMLGIRWSEYLASVLPQPLLVGGLLLGVLFGLRASAPLTPTAGRF